MYRLASCVISALLLTLASTLASGQETPLKPGATGSTLVEGLSTCHFPITTSSDEAQAWFDQGIVLLYGFNHGEAIRSFQEAAARDPKAAMPWWGIAYANGMHINNPVMTEAQWKDSYDASEKALSLLDDETAVEQALVKTVAKRTAWPVPQEQRPYDEAFAEAMKEVYAAHGDNPDVGVLYVESLMNLQPWDYWTPGKEPKGSTAEFVRVLERILSVHPDHPQACHLYIHAMEAGPYPARALAAADALRARVPAAGHLVHMPSHLYARIGRYDDALVANEVAVAADDDFFKVGTDPGFYYVYHAHNLHFLAFAAMMRGQYDEALAAARRLETAVPEPVLDQMAFIIEGIIPTTSHVMIRFGKWEDVLKEPEPHAKRPIMRATHYYARGIALSALGRTEEARKEIERFNAQIKEVPGDWWVFANRIHDVLPIAQHMLAGELAYREGRLEDAWAELEKGIQAEDKLVYDEPPGWVLPVRHAMGALLMEAGEYARAETLYRQDQLAHPGNGWSLLGLKQALEAQGKGEEAVRIAAKLDEAWNGVKSRPTSSCACAPLS
ncbi:MAG: tetratricopeptide repeat protein [Candidatus Hydrogenedentes bacterium]|nr:tetratricopeptide repeat protein [Candidatus Hydrogenedentota bacterium]